MKLGSKNKESKKEVIGKIRRSQIITTFGPGAVVDMPYYSVVMASASYWKQDTQKRHSLYEPNLQRLLGVKKFMEPIVTETDLPIDTPDLPAFRFPMMHYCPNCKKLMSYREFGNLQVKKCPDCGKELIPSRFIVACINGHLEDFPFKWWVHHGNFSDCPAKDRNDQLTVEFTSASGGLDSIIIKCKACGRQRSMAGCMNKGALKGYKCRGKRPWLGMAKKNDDSEECHAEMRTLQRNASNVYFSMTQSALTIPPWSKAIHDKIEADWSIIEKTLNKKNKETQDAVIEALFDKFISQNKYSLDEIKKEIYRKLNLKNNDKEFDEKKLFEEEYRALCKEYNSDADDKFKSIEVNVPETFREYFDNVFQIKRLREILALKGFRRITPILPDEDDPRGEGMNDKEYVPAGDDSPDWLPAIEMLGEGIFIRFNEKKVKIWEKSTDGRYEAMKTNLGKENLDHHKFSARYVLLHTFAHLLIRELTEQCGYSGAALKERIYSTYPDSNMPMAGVLVYTSSSDSDGSLGGLARQGETNNLNNMVLNLLQNATWCSSDPLCIESMEQGYNSLNYAACHACTLLPETSCEARNCFLDRVAVVGKMEKREKGYFGKLLLS